jgi:hypothetical protein
MDHKLLKPDDYRGPKIVSYHKTIPKSTLNSRTRRFFQNQKREGRRGRTQTSAISNQIRIDFKNTLYHVSMRPHFLTKSQEHRSRAQKIWDLGAKTIAHIENTN